MWTSVLNAHPKVRRTRALVGAAEGSLSDRDGLLLAAEGNRRERSVGHEL